MAEHEAVRLLNLLFEPTDYINIVAAKGGFGWEGQTLFASEAVRPEFIKYLTDANNDGASIYFCVNPLASATPPFGKTSARTKQNVSTIKNIMLDVDHDVERHYPAIQELTPPGYVQATSEGKLQKIWRVRNFDEASFKKTTDAFFGELGGDEKCGDICRLFRLPGFYNRKDSYSANPPLVSGQIWANYVCTPESFKPLIDKYNAARAMSAKAEGKDFNPDPKRDPVMEKLKRDAGLGPVESRINTITLGANFQCPFHDESESSSHRSFGFINAPEGYPIFRCHHAGCDARGDVLDFVARYDGIDIGTAIQKVKKETYDSKEAAEYAAQKAAMAVLPVASVTPAVVQTSARPEHPLLCIEGDYIGELAHVLGDGTIIPLQFLRSQIKTILGLIIDDVVGFPGQIDLHQRHYSFMIGPPESGKGESWKRTGAKGAGCLDSLLSKYAIHTVDGTIFGSGQFMSKYLAKNPVTVAFFDEGRSLFEQAETLGSTLTTVFLSLFESTSVAQGSFKNGTTSADNVHLCLTGGFTPDSFDSSFIGKGSRGSGFLSRAELSAGEANPIIGNWPMIDLEVMNAVLEKIQASLELLPPKVAGVARWVPTEDAEAHALRIQFETWLKTQSSEYTHRLVSHMKRDLCLRALFSDDKKITADHMRRSIEWTKDQLALRVYFWPDDAGTPVERMERAIVDCLTRNGKQSERIIQKFCNVSKKGSGGYENYARARRALLQSNIIESLEKNRNGNPIYSLVVADD